MPNMFNKYHQNQLLSSNHYWAIENCIKLFVRLENMLKFKILHFQYSFSNKKMQFIWWLYYYHKLNRMSNNAKK